MPEPSETISKQTAREYSYDSQAIALFSLKSACVVATVLSVPDAVALIPSVSTITSWVLKIVACWTTALLVWFLFSMFVFNLMKLVAIGVLVDENGIKLWKYGKLIPWENIEAVSLEPEYLFTAVLSYDKVIHRLTLYKRLEKAPKFLKLFLVPMYVPSYLFSPESFIQLTNDIVSKKYSLDPEGDGYLLFNQDQNDQVRGVYKLVTYQRLIVSILISVGLSLFLVRKSCVLYSYNEGLHEYRHHLFQKAEKSFSFSVGLDPTFAPAWHGLAGSQFNVGDFENAKTHWLTALKWKPDYVEAKVSLAYLSLQNREFDKAQELLDSALHIDPYNSAALLNKADLELRIGNIKKSSRLARLVMVREEGRSERDAFMAKCLLAHAKLIEGYPKKAQSIISDLPFSKEKLKGGENLTYRLIVGSKIYLKLDESTKALRMAQLAMKRSLNVDTLLLMAEVRLARKQYDAARTILKRCRELMPDNPWIYELAAEINYRTNHHELAYSNLIHCINLHPKDANILVRAAHLLIALDHRDIAHNLVKIVLHMSPDYPLSLELKKLVEAPKPLEKLFPE